MEPDFFSVSRYCTLRAEGLRPDLDAHIWLVHHLFLCTINQDAQDWACTWNEHNIRFDAERTRSLRDMFFFGMIENGVRGFNSALEVLDDDEIDDLDAYGVDWDDLNNPDLIAHRGTTKLVALGIGEHLLMSRTPIIYSENLFRLLNSYSRDHTHTYCLFQLTAKYLDINIGEQLAKQNWGPSSTCSYNVTVKNSFNFTKGEEIWRKGWYFNPFTECMVGANKLYLIGIKTNMYCIGN
jgi:hypothetical protein